MQNTQLSTRAKISIVIACILLGGVMLVYRAEAPEVVETSRGGEENTLPQNTTTTGQQTGTTSTPPRPKITTRSFTLQIGQQATVDGYKFALRNIEDSRCPDGVQCIRAGEVKAYIQVEYGTTKKEITVNSTGGWASVGGRQVRVTKISPAYPSQIIGSYIVFLEARRTP